MNNLIWSDPIQSSLVWSIFCRCHIVTSLKVILGIFGNLRIHSKSFWVILGHFGSFLVLVTTLEDGTCFKFFCQPKFSLCCIIYVFHLEQYNTKIYLLFQDLKLKLYWLAVNLSVYFSGKWNLMTYVAVQFVCLLLNGNEVLSFLMRCYLKRHKL